MDFQKNTGKREMALEVAVVYGNWDADVWRPSDAVSKLEKRRGI
jgi:hypothetical protein